MLWMDELKAMVSRPLELYKYNKVVLKSADKNKCCMSKNKVSFFKYIFFKYICNYIKVIL